MPKKISKPTKTVEEKFATRLSKIQNGNEFTITSTSVKVGSHTLFTYSPIKIEYSFIRYIPRLKEDIVEEDFTVTILLTHETLPALSTNISKPPRGARHVIDMVRYVQEGITGIVIGAEINKIQDGTLYVTYGLYSTLVSINKEEAFNKIVGVRTRVAPFLFDAFGLESPALIAERDYALSLQEIIASKQFTQDDIIAMTSELESGENNKIVIEKQINKQAAWLLEAIEEILEETDVTVTKAKEFGNRLFSYPRASISGPEKLMEKILTDYGQHIIFGVPALLNINKYVIAAKGLSRSQFDILLITALADVEIVELKRPDEYLLDYDSSRGKFYMSKDLSIASAQSERYISAIYKDHDTDFTIGGKTIGEYIDSEIGDKITLSICRPRALIVMGALQRIVKPYDELTPKVKAGVKKEDYYKNAETAYKEIKSSFKNVDIITYSELVEGARLRLYLAEEKDSKTE